MPKIVPKTLWFDLETTGLNHDNAAVVQMAAILEIDYQIEDEWTLDIRPHSTAKIEEGALAKYGGTLEELQQRPHSDEQFNKICSYLDSYVDRYNPLDKMIPAGFNVKFDLDFLTSFFKGKGDDFLFARLHASKLDVMGTVALARHLGLIDPSNMKGNKLEDLAVYYKIPLKNAHNALDDIKATRTLFYAILDDLLSL